MEEKEKRRQDVAAADDHPSTSSQDAATGTGMRSARTTNACLVASFYPLLMNEENILQILYVTASCRAEDKYRALGNVLLVVCTLSVQMGLAISMRLVQEAIDVRYKLRNT
jgi:hypothetical protein